MIEIDFYRSCGTSISYPFDSNPSHLARFSKLSLSTVPQSDTHSRSGGGVVSFNLEIP